MQDPDIYEPVRQFIVRMFLKGRDTTLTPTTPLVSSGILDSLAVTELIMFLEDHMNVQFSGAEADPARFDTLELIVQAVAAKR